MMNANIDNEVDRHHQQAAAADVDAAEMSSSSSSSSLSSRLSALRIGVYGEKNEKNPSTLTGMSLGFQQLEERLLRVPSISDIIGCGDVTLENIQFAKQELINQRFDLKMDVNKIQALCYCTVTPLTYFCKFGKLLIVKVLFLIGADCTQWSKNRRSFPMLTAATYGHLDICKWLFEYGGDAKYQINKEETITGSTPLSVSYAAWLYQDSVAWLNGWDREGKTCRWLLQNGGGQHLSPKALRSFSCLRGQEGKNSDLLVIWMRENIQLYDTFIFFLCGAATITIAATSTLLEQERSLQILDGCPGIMELIGDYMGLVRGKEIRMLKEFNELVFEYIVVIDYDKIKPESDTFKHFKRFAGGCGNGCIRIQGKKVIVSEYACPVCVYYCKQGPEPGDAVSIVKRVTVVVGA